MISMNRSKLINLLLVLSPLLAMFGLYGIFNSTDPATIGPGGILGVFILMYIGCLSMIFVLLRFGIYWVVRLAKVRSKSVTSRTPVRMNTKKAYYVASVLGFAPVTLVAMHAFSELQWTDVFFVSVLLALVTFYVIKRQ